jgi:hypothetical protein
VLVCLGRAAAGLLGPGPTRGRRAGGGSHRLGRRADAALRSIASRQLTRRSLVAACPSSPSSRCVLPATGRCHCTHGPAASSRCPVPVDVISVRMRPSAIRQPPVHLSALSLLGRGKSPASASASSHQAASNGHHQAGGRTWRAVLGAPQVHVLTALRTAHRCSCLLIASRLHVLLQNPSRQRSLRGRLRSSAPRAVLLH